MLTLQQLIQQLESGESQLVSFRKFRNELKTAETGLQILENDIKHSQYKETIKPLLKWLDWFITDTGYEESVLVHNVDYINRRLDTYPAIELAIEERSRQIRERLESQNQES